MISVEWLKSKPLTKSKLESTYVLVEKLRKAGFSIPDNFSNTHWMKLFNKLNSGTLIYLAVNPFCLEVDGEYELIWSSNKENLSNIIDRLAEDI